MALGQGVVHRGEAGDGPQLRAAVADFTLDASYPTGGYPVTPGLFGMSVIYALTCAGGAKGYQAFFDQPNNKLMLFRQTAATSALVEVPNATDVSAGGVIRAVLWGANE